MADPSLIAAAVSGLGIVAGLIGTWIRARAVVKVHRARASARREVIGALSPGSRLIDLESGTVIIEVGPRHACAPAGGASRHTSSVPAVVSPVVRVPVTRRVTGSRRIRGGRLERLRGR